MKSKILIATVLLLAILAVGTVSASEDIDVLTQDSDILAQEAYIPAEDANITVIQENVIDDKLSSFDDEFEGNFKINENYLNTDNGDDTFATLNLQTATEGKVVISDQSYDIIYENYLNEADFQQSGDGFSYDILVGDVDLSDVGKEFLKFKFYDRDDNSLIHEVYQIDKNKNNFVIYPAVYMEIYDGLINENTEGPIVVVFAEMQYLKYRTLAISDSDYTFGYFPDDLTRLTSFNHGIYSKNHMDGWAYYGITAARLMNQEGFDSSLNGKNLSFIAYKVINGNWGDRLAEDQRTVTFTGAGFYFGDGNDDEGDDNDFYMDFRNANIVENEAVIILPQDQIPEGIDDEFIIFVDLWGNYRETVWNIRNLIPGKDGYEWTTSDLNIDELMWDIYPGTDVDIGIQFYRDGETSDHAEGQVHIFNTPYIPAGEIDSSELESVVAFAYFPEGVEDEFIIRIYKDGSFSANRTFKISEMDRYKSGDDYSLYLNDLGISEFGKYRLNIIFTDEDTQKPISYNGTFTVVPFAIHFWYNWDDVTEPFCRINLPEDAEGTVTVKVNGNKVFEKTLEDIGYTDYRRGPGYYVEVNSLNITESGLYEVEVTVDADVATRTVSVENYANVTENTFEFIDFIYGNDGGWRGFNIDMHVSTAISPDSEISLYLNGIKAAAGNFDGGLNLTYVDDSLTDIYGSLKPGKYLARLEIDGKIVGEGAFNVLDDSGDADVEVINKDCTAYVNFKSSMPSDESLDGYGLAIYVDAVNPNYWDPEDEPFTYFEGDELRDLLDNKVHAIELSGIKPSKHTIYVVYRTDMDYPLEEQDFFVRIYNVESRLGTIVSADDVTVNYGDANGKLIATLTNAEGTPLSANIIINLNGKDYTIKTNSKGQASVSTASLAPGEYTATITYKGNSKYAPSTTTTKVTVNSKLDSVVTAQDVTVKYGDANGKLIATLTNAEGIPLSANIVITLNGVDYAMKTNSKGQASVSTASLNPGEHIATIVYKGNSKYSPSSATAKVTVTNKLDSVVSADDVTVKYGDANGKLIATLTNAKGVPLSANIVINLNGVDYAIKTNSKGQASVSTANLAPGEYTATATYKGNSKYNPSTTTAKVTVTDKLVSVVSAEDVTVRCGDANGKLIATLTNAEGTPLSANIVISLNGVSYSLKTNSKGQASVSTKDLAIGEYTATITYKGNSKYAPSTTTAKVIVNNKLVSVVTASDVTVNYGDAKGKLIATLTNAEGTPLSANLVVNLNGVDYTLKSNSKGNVAVSTADLAPGKYTATITYKGNSKYNPSTTTAMVTVTDRLETRISGVYNTETKEVTGTLTNAEGTPLSANVVVSLNGVNHALKSDSKGQFKVSAADLAPGSYTAKLTYKGNSKYAPSSATVKVAILN